MGVMVLSTDPVHEGISRRNMSLCDAMPCRSRSSVADNLVSLPRPSALSQLNYRNRYQKLGAGRRHLDGPSPSLSLLLFLYITLYYYEPCRAIDMAETKTSPDYLHGVTQRQWNPPSTFTISRRINPVRSRRSEETLLL